MVYFSRECGMGSHALFNFESGTCLRSRYLYFSESLSLAIKVNLISVNLLEGALRLYLATKPCITSHLTQSSVNLNI